MLYTYYSLLAATGLMLAMLLLMELGHQAGVRRAQTDGAGARTGLGTIDAAVFSLLGLLIAFTFSGAATRFDARRQLSIQESNSIGTAWLRLDVLPESARSDLREQFRQYLDARLRVARAMPDLTAARNELRRCSELQSEIWARAVSACADSSSPMVAMLILPALNQMFDIASTRTAGAQIHPPLIIFALLCIMSLASALLAGYGMAGKHRSWIHMVGLAAAVGTAVFVIFDLEYPRAGLIRIDESDQVLVDLRQTMR